MVRQGTPVPPEFPVRWGDGPAPVSAILTGRMTGTCTEPWPETDQARVIVPIRPPVTGAII